VEGKFPLRTVFYPFYEKKDRKKERKKERERERNG
jgi:hypothetical protein